MGKQFDDRSLMAPTAIDESEERKTATAIKRVLDRKTRKVVGWLYQWNSGHMAVLWNDKRYDDIVYE